MNQSKLNFKFLNASNDVPWERCGNPFSVDKKGKWENNYVNIGAYKNRLFSDEQIINNLRNNYNLYFGSSFLLGFINERSFAKMWDYYINGSYNSNIVNHLLGDPILKEFLKNNEYRYFAELVMQSVIQWLGTNCGSCFIDEAKKLAKVDSEKLKKELDSIFNKIELEKIVKEKEKLLKDYKDNLLCKQEEINSGMNEINKLQEELDLIKKEWIDDFENKVKEYNDEQYDKSINNFKNQNKINRNLDI